MKKKQIIAGALSVFLLGTVIMPVHAEDVGRTEVTYTQPNSWTVSIPKTTLSQTEEVEQTVSATAMNIRPDKKLQVTIIVKDSQGNEIIDNQGRITLKRGDGETTTSVVSTTTTTTENSKYPITSDTVIAEFENQSIDSANGTTGTLYFSAVPENTKAGDYTGSIVYVMETVDKN